MEIETGRSILKNSPTQPKVRSMSSDRHRIKSHIAQSHSTPNFRKLDSAHKSNPTLVKGDFMPKQLESLEARPYSRQRSVKRRYYYPSNSKLPPNDPITGTVQQAETTSTDCNMRSSRSLTLHNIRDILLEKTRDRLFQTHKNNKTSSNNSKFSPTVVAPHTGAALSVYKRKQDYQNNYLPFMVQSYDYERTASPPMNATNNSFSNFSAMPKSRSFHSMKNEISDDYCFNLAAQFSIARETDL